MIFNIQRYSTHDGPGIRTVVFFKGCPIRCRWCQNPESCSRLPQVLFDRRLCLPGCELCLQAAPQAISRQQEPLLIQREKLRPRDLPALENCCPTQALTLCGEEKSAEQIMAIVRRDRAFYQRSAGGITLSGGEPFMQPQLAEALLRSSHQEKIHTAVESCLHVPWRYIEPSLPYTDLFLADLKHTDEAKFYAWTKGSAQRVLGNLRKVAAAGKPVTVRVPLIPGFNADRQSIQNIVGFAAGELCVSEIHFLPYHTLGRNKYVLLDQPYSAPDKPLTCPDIIDFAQSCAERHGLVAILRG